jgi:NAD(P)-dependent dehydrogenase (short-subunit alcohol dehydrogenase family)
MSLEGKVVLVTGGSSGIGRAAVLAFGRAGARVAFAGRRQQPGEEVESLARTEGHDAHYIRADVARAADAERLVALTVARYGRIDAAFNNAATEDGAFALTADFTEEQFETAMQANLKSVWLCMKFELRQMLSQSSPGGTIVNTSSVNGLGGAPGGALYSAAKAGVLALTKSAAQEYATRGFG